MTADEWKTLRDAERDLRRTYQFNALGVLAFAIACSGIYIAFDPTQHFPEFCVISQVAAILYWCFVFAEIADARQQLRTLVALYVERDILRTQYVDLKEFQGSGIFDTLRMTQHHARSRTLTGMMQ